MKIWHSEIFQLNCTRMFTNFIRKKVMTINTMTIISVLYTISWYWQLKGTPNKHTWLQPWLQPNLLMCWIPVPLQNVFLLQILMQSKEMKKTIHISLCSYFLISYNFSIFFLFFYYLNVSLSDFSGWLIYFQRNFHNCQVLYADCET